MKGYGDTHARGWRNFEKLMAQLPWLEATPGGGARLRALAGAALADDTGQALDALLASA